MPRGDGCWSYCPSCSLQLWYVSLGVAWTLNNAFSRHLPILILERALLEMLLRWTQGSHPWTCFFCPCGCFQGHELCVRQTASRGVTERAQPCACLAAGSAGLLCLDARAPLHLQEQSISSALMKYVLFPPSLCLTTCLLVYIRVLEPLWALWHF